MPAIPFRAALTPALVDLARERFGLDGDAVDVGGTNLNVRLGDHVLRVYSPWVTAERVRFVQRVRAALRAGGLPFTETVVAVDGATVVAHDGRAVEVEVVVDGHRMDEATELERALPMLARVHDSLAEIDTSDVPDDVVRPRYPNHVDAAEALVWAERAAALVTTWPEATATERESVRRLVDLATALAPREPRLPAQLVHGDFWDNNVLFDDAGSGRITAVLDLDFCGPRPRVDDLALTLYYVTAGIGRPTVDDDHRRRLDHLVDAYDAGLSTPLSGEERAALVPAVARTVLFLARNLVAVDDREHQRRILVDVDLESRWSLDLLRGQGSTPHTANSLP